MADEDGQDMAHLDKLYIHIYPYNWHTKLSLNRFSVQRGYMR